MMTGGEHFIGDQGHDDQQHVLVCTYDNQKEDDTKGWTWRMALKHCLGQNTYGEIIILVYTSSSSWKELDRL